MGPISRCPAMQNAQPDWTASSKHELHHPLSLVQSQHQNFSYGVLQLHTIMPVFGLRLRPCGLRLRPCAPFCLLLTLASSASDNETAMPDFSPAIELASVKRAARTGALHPPDSRSHFQAAQHVIACAGFPGEGGRGIGRKMG